MLDSDELLLGQSLPGNLCDKSGRVLIRAGQVLTQEHLQSLGTKLITGVYGGEGWGAAEEPSECEPATPASVMEELVRRHGDTEATTDQRAHQRQKWTVPLTVQLEERGQYGPTCRTIEVSTVDISCGGFAFVFRQYISPGTTVRVQFDSLPNRPRLEGAVRGCILIGGNQHRVGVQFTETKKPK